MLWTETSFLEVKAEILTLYKSVSLLQNWNVEKKHVGLRFFRRVGCLIFSFPQVLVSIIKQLFSS